MNYPPLAKLRSFVAVANEGSFRKAAEQLHLSPPALSAHIRDLEDFFDLPLFHRTTRSVSLTDDGNRLLVRSRRLLEELEAGIRELKDHASLQRGRVIVTCMPTVASTLLADTIATFLKRYPSIEIRAFDEIAALSFSACETARLTSV